MKVPFILGLVCCWLDLVGPSWLDRARLARVIQALSNSHVLNLGVWSATSTNLPSLPNWSNLALVTMRKNIFFFNKERGWGFTQHGPLNPSLAGGSPRQIKHARKSHASLAGVTVGRPRLA